MAKLRLWDQEGTLDVKVLDIFRLQVLGNGFDKRRKCAVGWVVAFLIVTLEASLRPGQSCS